MTASTLAHLLRHSFVCPQCFIDLGNEPLGMFRDVRRHASAGIVPNHPEAHGNSLYISQIFSGRYQRPFLLRNRHFSARGFTARALSTTNDALRSSPPSFLPHPPLTG